jgi:hypothetical protein
MLALYAQNGHRLRLVALAGGAHSLVPASGGNTPSCLNVLFSGDADSPGFFLTATLAFHSRWGNHSGLLCTNGGRGSRAETGTCNCLTSKNCPDKVITGATGATLRSLDSGCHTLSTPKWISKKKSLHGLTTRGLEA